MDGGRGERAGFFMGGRGKFLVRVFVGGGSFPGEAKIMNSRIFCGEGEREGGRE